MATSRDICENRASGQASEVTTSVVSGHVDISQLLRNTHFPPNVFQGNSEATVDKDSSQFVTTDSFWEARYLLKKEGRVVLCGPPGCGKTTVAYALCRMCRDEGFAVYSLERLEQWKTCVGERERSVVVLDGTLGEVRVDSQQRACWKRILDTPLQALKQGSCRLIITVYPHVLRELQQLESSLKSPLRGHGFLVDMAYDLPVEVRKKMLDFHLKELHLDTDGQAQIVESIVQTDVSGPVFPWCCGYMVEHWRSSEGSTAIFSLPAEAYAGLLKQMVLDDTHGTVFAAVFCLTMKGAYHFLHHRSQTERLLKELGFDEFSPDKLARYADVLLGSMLSEGWFSRRVLYDAAGLAVGRYFRFATLLKVCDARFLVQYVYMTVREKGQHEGTPTVLQVAVGLSNDDCGDTKLRADDRQALVQRIFADIVGGNLQHICQHPSLQCPEFLQELDNYCSGDKRRLKQLLNAVDPVHQLPLLYWSAFNPSHVLTHWCLSNEQSVNKLSAHMLLAFSFFDNVTRNSTCRLQSSLRARFTAQHFNHPECVMEFPLLGKEDCLTKDVQQQMETITEAHSTYLLDAALPIPPDVVTVQLTDDKLQLLVKEKSHWYLVYRLLTDRQVSETDRDGHTFHDIAASSGQSAAITLSLKAGAVITQRNRQGVTLYQLAHKTRALAAKNRSKFDTDRIFKRLPKMDMAEVQHLLLQEISVTDKDSEGSTGLHVACREGRGDIADLFLELKADVHIKDSASFLLFQDRGHSPLHYACLRGLVHTVERLLERRADVTASTKKGNTALHCACLCDSHSASADISRLLLHAGADVNKKNEAGTTPLMLAAMNGHTDTADLLIQRGANVNVQNEVGDTPLLLAAKEGHTDTADLLIQRRANVNVHNKWGDTPLLLAAKEGHKDTADLLIQRGANVNVQNEVGDTPLLLAAKEGHTDTADLLIQRGANVNVHNKWGDTPLLLAAVKGHTDTTDLLTQRGANVNVQNEEGDTPLLWAARNGHTDTADLLIQRGANVNVHSKRGNTPLLWAVHTGHTDTADLLTQRGANVNVQNEEGDTPLLWAARNGHTDTADLLIQHGANVNVQNEEGDTPLLWAATNGDTDTADLLIQRGANVNVQNKEGDTPLMLAALNGHTDTANLLTQHGANVNVHNKWGDTPLLSAAMNGHTDTADLLTQHGANVNVHNKWGDTPLLWAAKEGHTDTADLLIQRGANVNVHNKWGDTPLLLAAVKGHTDTTDLLTQRGANVNVQNEEGDTPLLWAARNGHTDTADLLIQRGANVNVHSKRGNTPLLWAVHTGHTDTADLLTQRGANVNVQNEEGDTPLLWAARKGHTDTADLLTQRGANVNVQNEEGDTPLLLAVREGHTDIADLLTQRGANVNVQNEEGDTPLLLAVRKGHTDTADLLKQHGANFSVQRQ